MNYLDLFSGIGGFAYAAQLAGLTFTSHYYSEIEPYAISVYKRHWPDAINLGDITRLKAKDIKERHQGEWLVTGGFPCQDVSESGRQRGLAGSRSSLWWEMFRVIGEIRPAFVLIENVSALRYKGLDRVLCCLASIGYDAEWQAITGAAVGAPHVRERMWIVAYPNGDGCGVQIHAQTETVPEGEGTRGDMGEGTKLDTQSEVPNPWADWPGVSTTGVLHAESIIRRMDHGVSDQLDKSRLRALGNAIVPQVAAMILKRIKLLSHT